MKKNIFISLLIGMMGVMAFMGCERPETIDPTNGQPQRANEDSLINQQEDTNSLSFITATSKHFINGVEYDSLYIINTQLEYDCILGNFIFDSVSNIDFSTQTLFFVQSTTTNQIGSILSDFIQIDENFYQWNIMLDLSPFDTPDLWNAILLVTTKEINISSISLNVTKNE